MARTQAADYDERKEAILSHAAALFAEKGYLGTSVMDIARACGSSKALLYHYYPSKEDVLFGVMSSHIDVLLDDAAEILAERSSPTDSLHSLLHRFMDHYVGAASRQKVLLNELDNLPVDIRRTIVAKQRRIVEVMQSLLTSIHPQMLADPVLARAKTMLVFGMINWTSNWYDPAGKLTPSQIADLAFEMAIADGSGQLER